MIIISYQYKLFNCNLELNYFLFLKYPKFRFSQNITLSICLKEIKSLTNNN
jgi:hypothetical protein